MAVVCVSVIISVGACCIVMFVCVCVCVSCDGASKGSVNDFFRVYVYIYIYTGKEGGREIQNKRE